VSAYPWPVRPFDRQHPVRGFFRDPRIGDSGGKAFHMGIDISAPDGTAVYAVAPGRVSIPGKQIVAIAGNGRNFGYWHILPAVKSGSRVKLHGLLGHIAPGWGHVHLAEHTTHPATQGTYWNPLRPGALTPFADFGAPVVARISSSHDARALSGLADFIVEAFDHPPISAPAPWHDIPVTPAFVRWRLRQGANQIVPWHIAADFRTSFVPGVVANSDRHFTEIYAPGTRQNHPNKPGLFRFWLARRFDTRSHPDGNYQLVVEAADIRGNTSTSQLALTFVNNQ
jgi:hypothetical protein